MRADLDLSLSTAAVVLQGFRTSDGQRRTRFGPGPDQPAQPGRRFWGRGGFHKPVKNSKPAGEATRTGVGQLCDGESSQKNPAAVCAGCQEPRSTTSFRFVDEKPASARTTSLHVPSASDGAPGAAVGQTAGR